MKIVLQVNTGSLTHIAADGKTIVQKLSRCLDLLEVDKVIYGWSPDREVNETLVNFLGECGIEKYLWLPIFCEIHDPQTADAFVSVSGKGNQAIDDLCQGESFDFVCQSSEKNIRRAIDFYDEMTKDLPVDGVFIDRIRYASAANSVRELYGCWCPRCRAIYEARGVDVQRLERMGQSADLAHFMPRAIERGVYRYEDEDVDALMQAKRSIITDAVGKLSAAFRQRGRKIGIDTFATGVADFVGQDLLAMGPMADFIKPMVYLKTYAPAGVPFEIGAMGEAIEKRMSQLFGADARAMDAAVAQMADLVASGVSVAPGIDANRIDPICDASPAYVKTYLDRLEDVGCPSAVLAWDALRMGEDVLCAVAGR